VINNALIWQSKEQILLLLNDDFYPLGRSGLIVRYQLETQLSSIAPHASRFSGRADVYARYRPRYPIGLIRTLEQEIKFDREKIVADVGSGTGLLAELFVLHGNRVYCVEPNPEMRSMALQKLSTYPNFASVSGSAEATTLERDSVDLVTVGQALHWFNPEQSRSEFSRILREPKNVAIVYNERKKLPGFMKDYDGIIDKHARSRASTPDVDDAYLERFYGSKFRQFTISNSQILDAEGLLGRASSASYCPKPGEPGYEELKRDLAALFSAHQRAGVVELEYDTIIILGQVLA
jgi:SAM-dependent methyltransferase